MSSRKESANKRNKYGQGSIRRIKSGKYEYRVRYQDEFDRLKQKSFSCDTVEECLARAKEFKQDLRYKKGIIDKKTTLAELIRQKIDADYARNFTGESGYDRNLQTLAILEKDGIGLKPIQLITHKEMEEYLKSITSYSNTVIKKVYSLIKGAYKQAADVGIIQFNFMLLPEFRCPKSVKRDRKVRALTEEEQATLVDALKEHKKKYGSNEYSLQLMIELLSGLRMGEINALRPSDIKLDKGYIHVGQTVSRGLDCRPYIKEGTKTYAGERDVPISKALRPILESALEEMKDNPLGLVFYDYRKKGIVQTSQVNCFYRRICEKAGIECFGQHALRHTFATRCIEAGVQPVVLKTWLGHTNIHMTLDIYSDVFDKMDFGALEKFDSLIEAIM